MTAVERRLETAEASLTGLTAQLEAQNAEAVAHRVALERLLIAAAASLNDVKTILNSRHGEAEAQGQETRQTLQRLNETVDRQSKRIAQLGMVLAETARIYPSWMWKPEIAARVCATMALLRPVSVPGVNKARLGRQRDGGYVMLDDFAGIETALSLGIADDVSWDIDAANRGIRILQFDPTVEASPATHPLFQFEPLRVAPLDADGAVSLDTIVRTRIESHDAPLVLKIDIEGDEWNVFLATSEQTMRRFKQIVCEFHNLERLGEEAFGGAAREVFTKLTRTHFVYHVHGNNCASFTNVGNVIVPQSLEVSFGLRAAYRTAPCTEPFPTPLDYPNEPGRADLYLGNFCFDIAPRDRLKVT